MLEDILMIGESALILNLSTQRVRQLAETGLLRSMRTSNGIRIFFRSDVLELKAKRTTKKRLQHMSADRIRHSSTRQPTTNQQALNVVESANHVGMTEMAMR